MICRGHCSEWLNRCLTFKCIQKPIFLKKKISREKRCLFAWIWIRKYENYLIIFFQFSSTFDASIFLSWNLSLNKWIYLMHGIGTPYGGQTAEASSCSHFFFSFSFLRKSTPGNGKKEIKLHQKLKARNGILLLNWVCGI